MKVNNNIEVEIKFKTLSEGLNTFTVDKQLISDADFNYDTANSEEETDELNKLNKKFETLQCDPKDLEVDCGDDLTIDDILKPVKNNILEENKEIQDTESEEDNSEEEIYNDDDVGWITPSLYFIVISISISN
jgi:hypothetical protein